MDTNVGKHNQTAERLLQIMFFTLIISVMNATIFNVVLPSISKEFTLSASQVSWITTGYGIMYAIGSVTYGKLADQYRLKDLLTFGLIFMSLGSLVGLIATQYWMIVVGRMLQAAGAAVIPSISMIIPVKYFTLENRGRAIGTMVSGLALGTAISPIVASFVTGLLHWRLLFCFSFLVLLTLPFFRKHLNDEPSKTVSKMDFIGGFLLSSTIVSVLLALTISSWIFFLIGLLLLILLILRIRLASEPFIQSSVFQSKRYTISIVIALLATSLSAGIPFITPQLLSNVNHISPTYIGFIMFPGTVASALLGRAGGKLADQKGNSFLFYLATIPLLIAFCVLSILAGMSPLFIWIFLTLANMGQTFIQIAMSNTVSSTLSKEHEGIGMGFFTMMTFIIGATSTTLISKVLDFGSSIQLNPLQVYKQTTIYSNAFFMLTVVLLLVVVLHFTLFRANSDTVLKSYEKL
ncbi:MFS transporter [Rhodococcus qingshengii]|nr:MFS transporter [Rhodococcus qingshengii]